MNLKLDQLIEFIKPIVGISGAGAAAQKQVERWVTPPKAQRDLAYAGLSQDDKAEAERLLRIATDAISDYTVFVASRGVVEAD